MKAIIDQVSNTFENFFLKRRVNRAARNSGFTKRKPKKIYGYAFLLALTLGRFKK